MAKGAFVQSLVDIATRNVEKAKEAGFDTKSWYHGSGAENIPEIDLAKHGGKATNTPASKEAFFLVNNPEAAEGFAKNASKTGKVHEFFYRPDDKTPEIDWNEIGGGLSLRSEGGQRYLAAILSDLREQGATGLIIKNSDDVAKAGEKAGDVLAVIDETALRYPNAAFKDLSSKSTMAGSAALAGGLAGASMLSPEQTSADEVKPGKFASKLIQESLEYGKGFAYQQSYKTPENQTLANLSEKAGKYNKWRKENVHPVADAVLPVSELPEDLLRKAAYGDKIKYMDILMAELGLL